MKELLHSIAAMVAALDVGHLAASFLMMLLMGFAKRISTASPAVWIIPVQWAMDSLAAGLVWSGNTLKKMADFVAVVVKSDGMGGKK